MHTATLVHKGTRHYLETHERHRDDDHPIARRVVSPQIQEDLSSQNRHYLKTGMVVIILSNTIRIWVNLHALLPVFNLQF